MVRVFLKGGVWKNSEDEVLKAAVQKYGKQQWARVASLLNRKSAKQCKARWYEWLDPSIRKTEWSRAEEEKLLQLAKLLPAQWKTIAPMVGRTATQCQEHYESLLDQAAAAAAGTGDDGAATSSLRQQSSAAAASASLLRPGQIDSHPETKPARPDPIDMDDDELEMLQEARARLANTQGKKAKRKQREKVLAQAKRLADLQKRRELKQAGLLLATTKLKSKRKKEIDLGVEIPFYKPAPAGFHDTTREQVQTQAIKNRRLKQVDFQQLNEQRYRSRDYEQAQRKKREEQRLQVLEQANQKYAAAKKAQEEQQRQWMMRPRGNLQLPEPTVTDAELGQLAKMVEQQKQHSLIDAGRMSSVGPTQALLGDYSDRPLPTPMRTPAVASGSAGAGGGYQDLMRQASRLRRLEQGQTPLLTPTAGADEDDQDDEEHYNDKDSTANQRSGPAGRTPASSVAPARRDELGLNYQSHRSSTTGLLRESNDAASVGASTFASTKYSIRDLARQERLAAKRARLELEAALAALPAPQFEYELAAPGGTGETDDLDEGGVVTVREVDQADVEAAERERLRKEAEKRYEARSSVMKRKDLPRPLATSVAGTVSETNDAAWSLVQEEMSALIQHDAYAFPLAMNESQAGGNRNSSTKKKKRKRGADEQGEPTMISQTVNKIVLDSLPDEALDVARKYISNELEEILNEKVDIVLQSERAANRVDALDHLARVNVQASLDGANEMIYTKKGWMSASSASKKQMIESLELEFDALQEATESLKKKNNKLQSKLAVVNAGYEKRADKLGQDILDKFAEVQNARIELSVYKMLQDQEIHGGQGRIEQLMEENAALRTLEASLQREYGDLVVEKRRLAVQLNRSS